MHEPEIEYLIRSLGIGATYRGYEYISFMVYVFVCLMKTTSFSSVSIFIQTSHVTIIRQVIVLNVISALSSRSVGSTETDRFSKKLHYAL